MGGERATATERNAPRKNTFYLNPAQPEQWIETDSLKFGRNGMSAAVLQDNIYAFGGAGGGGQMPNGPAPGGMPMNMPNDSPRRPPPGPPPEQGFSPLEVFRLKN
jgi:hypothetical protein